MTVRNSWFLFVFCFGTILSYFNVPEQEENVCLVKRRLCAPSSIGKLCPAPNVSKKRMFFASQEETIILNSRPLSCQGPSVVLYQDVFSQSLNDLNDETLEVTAEDHEWTREFLDLMATSYSGKLVVGRPLMNTSVNSLLIQSKQ